VADRLGRSRAPTQSELRESALCGSRRETNARERRYVSALQSADPVGACVYPHGVYTYLIIQSCIFLKARLEERLIII
jgi:hypothetical protein